MSKKQIDFFYDIVSPYSYLAAVQMEELEASTGAEVIWRPIFLAGLMRNTGNQPPQELPARKRYFFEQDLPRMASYLQVPYSKPDSFPDNTATLMRALLSITDNRLRAEKSLALYELYWGEGQPVTTEDVMLTLLGEDAIRFAQSPDGKQALIESTQEATDRGAYGAPTLFVDDQMFFGCDRILQLKHYLKLCRDA